MSRYRPPQPKSSPYITRTGFESLQSEQKAIWKHRAEVTEALSAAAAEGDRSENAEYIYRKKELREIDRRIRYLQKRLPDLKIVDTVANSEQIFFGATVSLLKSDQTDLNIRIVGSDEIDPSLGYISIDSPMAKVLLKKSVDDEVTLQLGADTHFYEVTSVSYQDE